jgi:DNA-binding response OmpR family regulator
MADLVPSHHRVLLVGPRVVGLKLLFENRRFRVMAAPEGVDGMALLDAEPCDLVLLELNLGDLTATEFLMAARQGHPRSTFLLIDDVARAGQIVRAMQAGLDGFLATPPDENRLFFEVDRHLRRVQGKPDDPAGFEEHATQTTMTTMADVEAVPGTPSDSNELERARQTIATLQQDVFRFEADARRYSEVQQALGDHLQARLDGDEAMRLRERLGLAQVGEIELMTLRGDVQQLRQVKRDQEVRIEQVLRDLKAARAAALATDDLRPTVETSMPTQPVAPAGALARIAELEADVAMWEMRGLGLETTLQAAQRDLNLAEEDFETAILEARATARIALDALGLERDVAIRAHADLKQRSVLLESEIERLSGALAQADAARVASDVRRVEEQLETDRLQRRVLGAEQAAADANARSVESEIRRTAATDDAITAAVDAALVAERARLHGIHQAEVSVERADFERQRTAALELSMAATAAASDRASATLRQAITVERDRAHQQQRIAVAEAVAAVESNAGQRMVLLREELEAQVVSAQDAAREARERADDFELQLEEARTRTEFLQEDAARVHQSAEDRVAAAQVAFKKEKLRLVEEKQTASSGSQEAMLKLERYRDEGAAARRAIEELQGQLSLLREAAAAGASLQERAEHELRAIADEREVDRERTRVAVEALARVEGAMGALQSHARSLEVSEAAARAAEAAAVADAALANARAVDSDTAVAQAAVAGTQLEILVARLSEEMQEVKDRAVVMAAELESQVAQVTRLQEALTLMEAAAVNGDALLSSSSSMVSALQSQLAEVEATAHDAALANASREKEHVGARVALMAELASLKASMADAAEAGSARLAQEQAASAAAADAACKAAVADADARVAGAAAREAAIMRAAEADLARVRSESQVFLSQAMQSVADLEQRVVAADADRVGLVVKQQRLIAQVLELEAEVAALKASALAAPAVGNSAEASAADTTELNRRINDLESQIARAAPAITATVRSLVDAVDPLRWGLGAAIDYMHPFEGNDPALASHVRNLRLLQATLARLVSESGKGPERP